MAKKVRQTRVQRVELKLAGAELAEIRQSLDKAYECFNSTSDPELTDACIFEINALRARYDHALRVVKNRLL